MVRDVKANDSLDRGSTSKRRVLFYGGCHAEIFCSIFSKYSIEKNAEYDVVNQVKIIEKGELFDYEIIDIYDHIVFSPILNRPDYNTDKLRDLCEKKNVSYTCYPWLQWNGYFPLIKKIPVLGADSWVHGNLDGAPKGLSFEEFCHFFEKKMTKNLVEENLLKTTDSLREKENIGNTHINISNFIVQSYKNKRLFLTPDHPSKAIYDFLAPKIAQRIGVRIREDYFWSATELQEGLAPIHPAVVRALDLCFQDADYQHSTSPLGKNKFYFRDYQRILYSTMSSAINFKCNTPTYLKLSYTPSNELGDDEKFMIKPGTIISFKYESHDLNQPLVTILWCSDESVHDDVVDKSLILYSHHYDVI